VYGFIAAEILSLHWRKISVDIRIGDYLTDITGKITLHNQKSIKEVLGTNDWNATMGRIYLLFIILFIYFIANNEINKYIMLKRIVPIS
jgi:hypothetical protein